MTIDAVPASTCPNVFHARAAISGGIGGHCEGQPPLRHQPRRRLGVRDHHLTAGAVIRTVGCQHDVWHGPLRRARPDACARWGRTVALPYLRKLRILR
jgi:hypothetical protein